LVSFKKKKKLGQYHISYQNFFFHVVNTESTTVNGVKVQSASVHDLQIYGIVVTIILCFIVFGGVKIINRVAPAFLIPVLLSLFCIYVGIALARKDYPTGEYSI
jgi:potassium/chloride transporter 4/5/6